MGLQNQGVSYFREEQYFRHSWVMIIIMGISIWFWYIFYVQVVRGVPFGQHPMPTPLLLIFWFLLGLGLPILFYFMKLITEVREDGIQLRFVPFFRKYKKFPWEEIHSYHIRKYRPIREYGGWGIRRGLGGRAYNIRGNTGMQLELEFTGKLLIGTQKPEKFLEAVRRFVPEKQKDIQK
jgi:hypothetical protein